VKKRSLHVVVLAVLSLLLLGPVPNSLARPPSLKAPVSRAGLPKVIDIPNAAAAYGTGTVVPADALRSGAHSLLGLDVAFSGAAFSSEPSGADFVNEVRRLVAPKLAVDSSFGRGTGLELGIAAEPTALIGQLSQAAAPPSTDLIHKVIGPIGIPNILRAELLRSQAQSRAAQDACVLGPDQAYGLGSVLGLEVLGGLIATEARPPLREVIQSTSTTRIVKGSEPGRLGLQSETRQTIAPVTFFKGTPIQFTVEVLGEWVLRAVADGAKGSVHYGPRNTHPETPILRVLGSKGEVLGQLTTQMLLSNDGLVITIPGVAEIAVGENPRMIGGDADSAATVDPTAAAAAVDVVRVRLLDGEVADVRIGHMEAAVTVPTGGVQCPGVLVNQEADKPSVTPGGDFLYTITVTNPNDCVLQNVKLVETPSVDPADVKFEIVSVTPSGGDVSGGQVTFADLGPLGPGETKTITVKVSIPVGSAPGQLSALAVVNAVCPAVRQPTTQPLQPLADIPVTGQDAVDGPTVNVVVAGPTCVVPSLAGKTVDEAKALLEAAGCKLGTVTNDPTGKPEDAGKITTQNPPAGGQLPLGTTVDVTVAPPACTVPNLVGLTETEARAALERAGCRIGDVTPGGDNPEQAGKITEQGTPSGSLVPAGTDVDITIAGPVCTVPNLVGMSEAEARAAVEAQGCTLRTDQKATGNPADVGKVLSQNPGANVHVPKGSAVDVSLGVQVLGETTVRSQAQDAGTAPALVRTGGVALGGLALWLLITGLVAQLAGSNQLWRLVRRQKG
jgi:beta-lactam-binding protein with PASTA domain